MTVPKLPRDAATLWNNNIAPIIEEFLIDEWNAHKDQLPHVKYPYLLGIAYAVRSLTEVVEKLNALDKVEQGDDRFFRYFGQALLNQLPSADQMAVLEDLWMTGMMDAGVLEEIKKKHGLLEKVEGSSSEATTVAPTAKPE